MHMLEKVRFAYNLEKSVSAHLHYSAQQSENQYPRHLVNQQTHAACREYHCLLPTGKTPGYIIPRECDSISRFY
jgi:hypothetical protein